MKIDFANLDRQYRLYKPYIDQNIQKVLDSSDFIMGEWVEVLESELQDFAQVKNSITCSSGTDALLLSLMALGVGAGDEIITTPFTFISTAEVIHLLGARAVFVDIDDESMNIDVNQIADKISRRTRAIMPVNLFGQPADLSEISAIAEHHGLAVVVDGAQCFGARYNQKSSASYGTIYTTSFFPAKPLGCYGDGGAVFTQDDVLAAKIRSLRVHGQSQRYIHEFVGLGARLDTLQAGILLVKLQHYRKEIKLRQSVAMQYDRALASIVRTPKILPNRTSVWAQYTIRHDSRDMLREELANRGVPTAVHYPRPLHLQPCFSSQNMGVGTFPISEKAANQVLSLPMNAFLNCDEVAYVVAQLKQVLLDMASKG